MVDRHVIVAAEGGLFGAAPSHTVNTGPSIIVTPLTISRIVDIVRGWVKRWLGGESVLESVLPTVRPGEEPDPLPSGFRFGPYLIESELAPALMGRVYKARDLRQGVTVAVNVLAPSLRDAIGLYRFEQSAIAATISSDALREVGAVDGIPFAVVKYIEGVGAALDVAKVPWGRPTRR